MTDVTRLHPPPSKCLDLAKKADMDSYIAIGITEGVPVLWHSSMTLGEVYLALSLVEDEMMRQMRQGK